MKQKSVKFNYILNTLYQVLTLCIPLITAPYLSRTLGADSIGIQSFTMSNVSYFVLIATLGTTTYGQRKIASVRDDRENLTQSFWNVIFFRLMTVLAVSVLYVVFICNTNQYQLIYKILYLNIINVLVDITWFFQGIEQFSTIVLKNTLVRIAQVACIFLFINSPEDIGLYVAFICGFTVLANIWTWFSVFKYIGKPLKIRAFQDTKDILLLFLPTVATQVYLVLDKSMIGVITGSTYQNGCYEQAEKIVRMALTVVTSVATVILPRVANLYNNGEKEKALDYIYKGFKFVWFLAVPIMFGLIGISKTFVPIFFGEGFELVEILLPIFSGLVLFVSLAYVTGYAFLIPIGKQNIYTIVVVISAAFNLTCNLILIPRYGAVGAAIASVTAEAIGIIAQIIYCCKSGYFSLKKISDGVWKYFTAGIIMVVALFIMRKWMNSSLISLCGLIAIGVCIYFITLVALREKFGLIYIRNGICQIFKKFGKEAKL